MSGRQDKATTERFTRTLRELVKRPENKVCADCKRNDPRWASWNIGVFLCIRCSGIHRGMGTHISRVKSVDLDVWTPEQMDSIQKWGNERANLYWEAHLKKGHVPPDHKMESFIRSKYESKRWAMEGPPPSDPAVLQGDSSAQVSAPVSQPVSPPPAPHAPTTRQPSSAQPQPRHALLSTSSSFQSPITRQPPAPAQQATPAPPKPSDDLFSLDFHAPAQSSSPPPSQEQKKDVKQDILSLFSSAPSQPAAPAFGASPWGQTQQAPAPQQQQQWQQPQQQTSMLGSSGAGMWGASSGWTPATAPPPNNLWGAPAAAPTQSPTGTQQPNLFANSADVWGSSNTTASTDPFGSFASGGSNTGQKNAKDDVFGDIWGGFK